MLLIGVVPLLAQDATPSGTINFAFWDYGPNARPGWETIIADFNKEYPDITVNLVSATGNNWGEYLNGVATLIAGGEKPDTDVGRDRRRAASGQPSEARACRWTTIWRAIRLRFRIISMT